MKDIKFHTLLRKELLIFCRRHSNLVALILFTSLSIVASINGVTLANMETKEIYTAIETDQAQIASAIDLLKNIEAGAAEPGQWYDPRKPQSSILHEKRPVIPASPELAFLTAEEQKLTPPYIDIGMSTRHVNPEPFINNPTGTLYGSFDFIYAVVWILPLFIIVTSYDVLTRDRTSGSAPILIMQNASIYKIVCTRLSLRFSLFFLPLFILSIASFLLTDTELTFSAFYYLGLWLLALFLYMGIWFSIAAWVNAYVKNVTTAGLGLMSIWILSSLVIPTVISVSVNALEPPIDRYQAILDLRKFTTDANKKRTQITNDYYTTRDQNVADLQFEDEYSEYFASIRYPSMLAFDQSYKPVADEIEERRMRQVQWLRYSSILSPSLSFKLLNDDLAGKSPERRKYFLNNVDEYQQKWRGAFDKKISTLSFLTVRDYEEMPNYKVQSEGFIERNFRIWIVFLGLLIPFLTLSYCAKRALKKVIS